MLDTGEPIVVRKQSSHQPNVDYDDLHDTKLSGSSNQMWKVLRGLCEERETRQRVNPTLFRVYTTGLAALSGAVCHGCE